MEEILKSIRQDCRLAMNGIVSTTMRQYGMDYKLNFGLVIQQIRAIADKHEQSPELAERLWLETTRELKILSTFIYPIVKFTPAMANKWVTEIPNQEMREQLCINLLQELDFADQLAFEWSKSENEEVRTTGYWLMARILLTKKYKGALSVDYFGDKIWEDVISENIFLRNASNLVLKHIVRTSKEEASVILNKLLPYKTDSNPLKQEAYNGIAFEIEFIWC